MNETSIYNYRHLTEKLASSGQPTENELGFIIQAGYSTVINLGLHDAEYSIENEASIFEENNVRYIHIPVIFETPKTEDFDAFVKVLAKIKKEKIFIHCAANKRVSVFVALYRILTLGWEKESAMEDVKKIWFPNDVWQTFINQQLTRRSS